MLRRVFPTIAACLALTHPLLAQPATEPPPAHDNSSHHTADPVSVENRYPAARIQTLLARANFSPGLIDGKPGRKTKIAIEHYQKAHGLEVNGTLDDPTAAALAETDPVAKTKSWARAYTITDADVALITGPIPEDWNERAKLERSGYADLEELLGERGWCAVELVRAMNPDVEIDSLKAGDEVLLPDVRVKALPKLARVEINLTEKLVIGYGEPPDPESTEHGPELFLTHCSIAHMAEKRPVGELHVKVVATDPEYTFNPADWPEVDNVTTKLRIPPGPRNPVGLAWIGLDKPGYGMHGTVRPQDIGKTGSHGCFRLCNWDASRLARAVAVGTVVEVRE
jgi:hypothetical protein